jgi:nitrite reductase (NADH) small subunit
VAKWVRVCGITDAPKRGQVMEVDAEGVAICLANAAGELSAVANRCPHRGGPLGQGWLEGESVVCPWHSRTFNLKTGIAETPVHQRVAVFRLRFEGEDVLVDIQQAGEESSSEPL